MLDPACGSGNFLYVALAAAAGAEEVSRYAASNGLSALISAGPPAADARAGDQRLRRRAGPGRDLDRLPAMAGRQRRCSASATRCDPRIDLDTIRLQDALLDRSDPDHPKEADWPAADVIIGNPPFLGRQALRAELGDDYTRRPASGFAGRIPPFADLSATSLRRRAHEIAANGPWRAGLLATNSIRGGANRVTF